MNIETQREIGTDNGRLFIKEKITVTFKGEVESFTKNYYGADAVKYIKDLHETVKELTETCEELVIEDLMR